MPPSIINKFLPKEKSEYFLTLVIQDNKIKVASCQLENGEAKILATAEKETDGDWENITLAADSTIAQVEEKLPPGAAINKVILGLMGEYIKGGKIDGNYLENLSSLLKKLFLTPLGFVEIPQAIISYLQRQEGVPQTLILVRLGKNLTVSLVRVGQINKTISLNRSTDVASDLEKAISSFPEVEILPSRILIYDGSELEKTRQELLDYPWMSKEKFLHFPKIETAPINLDIEAVTTSSAPEVSQAIGVFAAKEEAGLSAETGLASQPEEEAKTGEEESAKAAGEPTEPVVESAEVENFGFVAEDILAKPTESLAAQPQETPPSPEEKIIPKKTSLAVWQKVSSLLVGYKPLFSGLVKKIPSFRPPSGLAWPAPRMETTTQLTKAFLPKIKRFFLPATFLLAFFVLALIAAIFWYAPSAKIVLTLQEKSLEQKIEVGLNPKIDSLNIAANEIPGLLVEIEEKGSKKVGTTGKKTVGEPARGEVTIYNKTGNSKTFKKGTVINSPNNLQFSLDDEVMVASASENIGSLTFGKQSVHVSAVEIGPEGNLGVGQEFKLVDFPTSSYSARNEVAFAGGTSREISVVSKNDQERLIASLSAELKEKAVSNIKEKVGQGEQILDKTSSWEITSKQFDKEVGDEATEFSLEVSAKMSAYAYRYDDVLKILEEKISPSIPSGFELAKDQTKIDVSQMEKRKDGVILLSGNFIAKLFPQVNKEEMRKNVAGKSLTAVNDYLKALGNISAYEIQFGFRLPFFGDGLPRNPQNITIESAQN
jgi:hypothetical protein